jgi:hypothetical protein
VVGSSLKFKENIKCFQKLLLFHIEEREKLGAQLCSSFEFMVH